MNIALKHLVVIYKSSLFFLSVLFYLFLVVMFYNLYNLLINDIGFFENLTEKNFPDKIYNIWNRKIEFIMIICFAVISMLIVSFINFLIKRIPIYGSIQNWSDNDEMNEFLKEDLKYFFMLNKKINLRDLSYFYDQSLRKEKIMAYHKSNGAIQRFMTNQKFVVKHVDKT